MDKQIEIYSTSSIGKRNYYIIYTNDKNSFNGEVHLDYGVRGDLTYPYVDYIEWDYNVNPDNVEEIETYVENNLHELMIKAEKI